MEVICNRDALVHSVIDRLVDSRVRKHFNTSSVYRYTYGLFRFVCDVSRTYRDISKKIVETFRPDTFHITPAIR